jgi:hypothetical protein
MVVQEATCTFDRSAFASREARRFVQSTMFKWGWRTALEDVQLVVGALVNNAVRHTPSGQIELRVCVRLRGARLRIEVTDGDPANRTTVVVKLGADRGNGLRIVDAVATSRRSTPKSAQRS